MAEGIVFVAVAAAKAFLVDGWQVRRRFGLFARPIVIVVAPRSRKVAVECLHL
jgi:hypothetical protein